jgi:plasmid stabilization system protein ParE
MRLELAPRAVRQAEAYARWWRSNRPDARMLFDDELRAALEQIRAAPHAGSLYVAQPGREHRRVLLPVTRVHVYYRLAAAELIRVVAVWSAIRARGPRI